MFFFGEEPIFSQNKNLLKGESFSKIQMFLKKLKSFFLLRVTGEEADYRMKVHIANKELNMDWEYPDRFYFPRRDPNLPVPHEFEPGKLI